MALETSTEKNKEAILTNGARICELWKQNPSLPAHGSMIPGLILVYWQINSETGNLSSQPKEDKQRWWEKANKVRPGASKTQLIDTCIALMVFEKVTGERL